MKYPYGSPPSLENANERPRPAAPNQSSPFPATPPPPKSRSRSRNGHWVTAGTHKLYVPADASVSMDPPAYSEVEPLRPNRSPMHRYQQYPHPAAPKAPSTSGSLEVDHSHADSQTELLRPTRPRANSLHSQSESSRPLRSPLSGLFQKKQKRAPPPADSSGWVDDSDDDSDVRTGPASLASNETLFNPPLPLELEFKSTVPRPPQAPYEQRTSERALAARKHAVWRKKIIDVMMI